MMRWATKAVEMVVGLAGRYAPAPRDATARLVGDRTDALTSALANGNADEVHDAAVALSGLSLAVAQHLEEDPVLNPPSASDDVLSERLAAELCDTYSILAHDGRGLHGQHYWLKPRDLCGHLRSWLKRWEAEHPASDSRESMDSMGAAPAGMERVMMDVQEERIEQDATWGRQDYVPERWLTILTEEIGELAEAILETVFDNGPEAREKGGYRNIRKEAVQSAAVLVAMIECMDRTTAAQEKGDLACPHGVPLHGFCEVCARAVVTGTTI